MNHEELQAVLTSNIAYSSISEEELIQHFKEKFDCVPYENSEMYIFHHEREFEHRNHLISLHQRNGGRVPMHIFHYIVITYVYEGIFTITVENEAFSLQAGDIIILDKHVPHSVAPTGPGDLGINIILHENYFANRFINKLPAKPLLSQFMIELMNHQHTHNHYLIFHTQKNPLVHDCIQNILCEHFDPKISSDDIIDNFIMILLTDLARNELFNTNLSVQKFKNERLLNEIIEYIQQHYQEGNLKSMCETFGYDPSYTSKLIKQFAGKTFKQMVNEERMKKAMILLQNKELPIYDIAQMVGIHNLTAFYKRFQQYTGLTPKAYRDQI